MQLGSLLNVITDVNQDMEIFNHAQGRLIFYGNIKEDYGKLLEYGDWTVISLEVDEDNDLTIRISDEFLGKPVSDRAILSSFQIDDEVTAHFFLQYDAILDSVCGVDFNIPKYVQYLNCRVSGKTIQYLSKLKDKQIEVNCIIHMENTPLQWEEYRIYINDPE